jgi:Family of unknown function (DUF6131)
VSARAVHSESIDRGQDNVVAEMPGRATKDAPIGRCDANLRTLTPATLLPYIRRNQENVMIALGIVLIVLGLLLPSLVPTFAFAHLLVVFGVILLVVGVVLAVAGRAGHAVGGRRHYY